PGLTRTRLSVSSGGRLVLSQLLLSHEKEVLVDLSLINRHALFDAHPDHLLPVDLELLRQFFGREVIRHWLAPYPLERKNPPRATRWRVRSHPGLSCSRTSLCPPYRSIHYPKNMPPW